MLRFPTTIATLKAKLDNQQYTLFEEFLRDILDVGHNLALVFGRHSAEYEATNYLFADAQFEIGEIKTCRDCYRHSNEKFDKFWFTIPCVTRKHELVYAKAPGFSYWPAKVVKINDDGKYDVRFFGGEHSRAIIHVRNIEPIDKNIRKLNNGQNLTGALQKAMNELKEHQKRLELSMNLFTFKAEKDIRENNTCKYVPDKKSTPTNVNSDKKKRNRRSTSSTISSRNSLELSQTNNKPSPMQKKNAKNDVKNDQKVDKPQPETTRATHKTSPKKVLESPVHVNNIQKTSSSNFGPAPKRVKLERERKLQEGAQSSNSSVCDSMESVSLPTISPKKGTKHPALTKLDVRLTYAKSVEEAHQVAITIMQEEIECFQKKVKQMEAKHQEEIRETKRNQWVRD